MIHKHQWKRVVLKEIFVVLILLLDSHYLQCISKKETIMGEGFILLTRGYGFMGGVYHPPFDTLKIGTSTDDIKLKLYR